MTPEIFIRGQTTACMVARYRCKKNGNNEVIVFSRTFQVTYRGGFGASKRIAAYEPVQLTGLSSETDPYFFYPDGYHHIDIAGTYGYYHLLSLYES